MDRMFVTQTFGQVICFCAVV